ncbi:hypothetical protein DEO72_LG5g525 [Vigna unguiculata]|uniref:Uncharacterized protein n=1 Tax=Vigna unguiculata TaxID=3917 RepID=A0A4D6LVK7_VIGUN|nr:hypothetical protein DEO72_LG5g525 [Vigna unguiculata]
MTYLQMRSRGKGSKVVADGGEKNGVWRRKGEKDGVAATMICWRRGRMNQCSGGEGCFVGCSGGEGEWGRRMLCGVQWGRRGEGSFVGVGSVVRGVRGAGVFGGCSKLSKVIHTWFKSFKAFLVLCTFQVQFLHRHLSLLVVLASAPPFFTSWQRCSPPPPFFASRLPGAAAVTPRRQIILAAATSTFQDFCVADPQKVLVNGLACKDPKLVEANDIFFSSLHIA